MYIKLDKLSHPCGTRMLMVNDTLGSLEFEATEATVVEWSPSGNYVKLSFSRDNTKWVATTSHHGPFILEILDPK